MKCRSISELIEQYLKIQMEFSGVDPPDNQIIEKPETKLEKTWKVLTEKEKKKYVDRFYALTKSVDEHRFPVKEQQVTCIRNKKFYLSHISLLLSGRKPPCSHEKCYVNCGKKNCLEATHLGIFTKSTYGLSPSIHDWIHGQWLIQNGCIIDENNHWIWQKTTRQGYAAIKWFGKNMCGHRLSLMAHEHSSGIATPENFEELLVRHGKDCPRACCNPHHLQWGTAWDNNQDQILHGKQKIGDEHPLTKYTEEFVKMVKATKGQGTRQERADRFNITYRVAQNIDSGRIGYEYNKYVREKYGKLKEKPPDYEIWAARLKTKINIEETDPSDPAHIYDSVHHICHSVDDRGYGRITIQGKTRAIHKISLEVKLGRPLDKDEVTRHLCLRKNCFNPNHLKEGTSVDNMKDKKLHGTDRVGENHPNASFSDEKVAQIRKEYNEGVSIVTLVKNHGISKQTIQKWVKNKSRVV